METWLTIDEYPGYEVSSLGRIRRVARGKRTFPGRILKSGDRGKGYLRVMLRDMGRAKTCFVHHLVANAFHGPRPSPVHEAAHMDGNKSNNSAANIRWVTRLENHSHKRLHGTLPCGERQHASKLTTQDVLAIRSLEGTREQIADAAKRLGVHPDTVRLAHARKTWRHLT